MLYLSFSFLQSLRLPDALVNYQHLRTRSLIKKMNAHNNLPWRPLYEKSWVSNYLWTARL